MLSTTDATFLKHDRCPGFRDVLLAVGYVQVDQTLQFLQQDDRPTARKYQAKAIAQARPLLSETRTSLGRSDDKMAKGGGGGGS